MPVGIKSINDGLTTQIDSDYKNYVQSAKGLIPSVGDIYFTGSGDASNLVFIRPVETGKTAIFSYGSAGGGFIPGANWWNPTSTSTWLMRGMASQKNTAVEYVVMCNASAAGLPFGNFGFQIFDESGQHIVFDSTFPYLSVQGFYYYSNSGPDLELALPPPPMGKKYFIGINGVAMTRVDVTNYESSFDEDTYGFAVSRVSDTVFTIHKNEHHEYYEGSGGSFSSYLRDTHTICVVVIAA